MRIKILNCFVFAVMILACCGKETFRTTPGEGEAAVEMKFTALSQARAVTAEESAIHTVDLLIFDGSVGAINDAVFLYARYAWPVSGSTYRAVLKQGSGLDIYFAINARASLSSLTAGMTYAEARELLVLENPGFTNLAEQGLPMWGMALDRTVANASTNRLGTVKLLRSMASVDIAVTAANFTLAKGHIFNGADKGFIPYSPSNISAPDHNGDFHTLLPEIPDAMATQCEWSSVPATANTIANVFYLYENDADGADDADDTGTRKRTGIILEGRWSGSSVQGNTFYPLAFRDPDTGDKIAIKRNHKYSFIITNVNGDGYPTPDEAKEAENVNMDYEVIEWTHNEDGNIHIDGPYYFSVSSKKVLLASRAGDKAELIFRTNRAPGDILMKYDESDAGVAGAIDTHNRFRVEVLTKGTGGDSYTCFEVTAKQDYGTTDNPAVLIVTVGRIKFTVEIEQAQVNWELGGNQNSELTFP